MARPSALQAFVNNAVLKDSMSHVVLGFRNIDEILKLLKKKMN